MSLDLLRAFPENPLRGRDDARRLLLDLNTPLLAAPSPGEAQAASALSVLISTARLNGSKAMHDRSGAWLRWRPAAVASIAGSAARRHGGQQLALLPGASRARPARLGQPIEKALRDRHLARIEAFSLQGGRYSNSGVGHIVHCGGFGLLFYGLIYAALAGT
jgi:hypothetical protein